ncbi:unnamed protein product [Candidula unifasciata]|uniref:Uncharacterized protein n=1 Tax=Candidula unifasciata TaxID=100452 RepID=A0A8S3YED3_9EUPU|nr:unnamed protein product [Candidula unifasciata]
MLKASARYRPKKTEYTGKDPPIVATTTPDPYVGIPEVIALNDRMFDNFIRGKDATMVFFYKKTKENSETAKNSFIKAAQETRREGHAYGAVDCAENRLLCMKQGVYDVTLPAFKLYSGGHAINMYDYNMRAEDMKKFMDLAPPPVPNRVYKSVCTFVGVGRQKK